MIKTTVSRLISSIYKRFFACIVNYKLHRYKYIHIMFNDKFNKPFSDFLNRNFSTDEHLIICKHKYRDMPILFGNNVYMVKSLKYIRFRRNNLLIFHSLFDSEFVDKLYNDKTLLDRSCWVVWGGDLYCAPRDYKNDFVRSNFFAYNTCDMEILEEKYSIKHKRYYDALYNFPVSLELLDMLKFDIVKKDYIQIQINNSCDVSTIDIMKRLYCKWRNKNIKIVTILSYGDIEQKSNIIECGLKLFGGNFYYIEHYLTQVEYAAHLNCNDILILNQNRQQGFGNIIASLYLGKKVFIRKSVTTYKYFTDRGICVYDTDSILSLDWYDFLKNNYDMDNRDAIARLASDDCLVDGWRKIFNCFYD